MTKHTKCSFIENEKTTQCSGLQVLIDQVKRTFDLAGRALKPHEFDPRLPTHWEMIRFLLGEEAAVLVEQNEKKEKLKELIEKIQEQKRNKDNGSGMTKGEGGLGSSVDANHGQ